MTEPKAENFKLMEEKTIRKFIAGHRGMVGSSLLRRLSQDGGREIITRDRDELNLVRQTEVEQFFAAEAVDEVYLANTPRLRPAESSEMTPLAARFPFSTRRQPSRPVCSERGLSRVHFGPTPTTMAGSI